jgi:cytidylate kinase
MSGSGAIGKKMSSSAKPPRTIAIDGPGASGKSAVGSLVAERLGYRFLDTGAMYRALTWFVLENGVDPADEEILGKVAPQVSMTVGAAPAGSDQHSHVLVGGKDATPFLVRPDVQRQAAARGEKTTLDSVLEELARRDAIDSSRETSPLRPAADAVIIKTDGLNLVQVVERIMALTQ